ncbi:MAG TPA: NRDE family protein [Chryseolinea sp.]|nr:NRDE family protein [Chryseolinea sp.]HPM30548.1 NRDE family protein [Chryseolinea sp.]
MCLIFLSLHHHPTYKLIVAANRDEFYNRKTAAADYWEDHPTLLGGRDLEASGTWMGMNTSGKISMLTNYRDPQNINPNAPSRGRLVSDFLIGDVSGEEYLKQISTHGKTYNGFNLINGTVDKLFYYSNYAEGIQQIKPGLHGLSNHLLDTNWPKVERGKEKLKPILTQSKINPEELFDFLHNDERAADNVLPQTGLSLERERALSSMFIKTDNYGSRCSTVILVDQSNRVQFIERVYNLETFEYTTHAFEFVIQK